MATEETNTNEEWRQVPGFPGYEISSAGKVRSYKRSAVPKHLKLKQWKDGYVNVLLWRDHKQHPKRTSRLIALAFHGAPPIGRNEAAHNDGDQLNNTVENIRWASRKENAEDSVKHGTSLFGEKNYNNKLGERNASIIKYLLTLGHKRPELAETFSVSRACIGLIERGISWKTTPPISTDALRVEQGALL